MLEELIHKVVNCCEVDEMESEDEDFASLPVKPRGAPAVNTTITKDDNDDDDDDDEFDMLPVKPRGGGVIIPTEDPFDNIPIKVRGGGVVNIQKEDPFNAVETSSSEKSLDNKLDSDHDEDEDFDNLPIRPRGAKVVSPVNNSTDTNGIEYLACQPASRITEEDEKIEDFFTDAPVKQRSKGVTFDLNFDDKIDAVPQPTSDMSLNDTDSGLSSQNTTNGGIVNQDFSYDLDEDFKPADSGGFMDDLDFLEQCGENDDDAANRKAELARKSLYVRFDPLLGSDSPVKPVVDQSLDQTANNTTLVSDDLFSRNSPSTANIAARLAAVKKSSGVDSPLKTSTSTTDDPFSPPKNTKMVTSKSSTTNPPQTKVQPSSSPNGLVEPLLYTQSDLDEVVTAREGDWQKKYEELESKIKEEIAMRDLLEQDHREKMGCVRKENNDMKQVVAQYEKTIVELTENSHHHNMFNEETLSETVRVKEQLQQELHSAETNLVDAYKRIEKLKFAIDTYKQNEDNLKSSLNEFQIKLKKSEERYQKLKQHAAEKVEAANVEINKVRKQKEIDLAGLQAALKRSQSKINSLEQEVQQKTRENQEFAQICDDLIKKVSGE